MSNFDADAFLDTIRAARESDAVDVPSRPPTSNSFDVDDFLHSIALARQIEEMEALRAMTTQVVEPDGD